MNITFPKFTAAKPVWYVTYLSDDVLSKLTEEQINIMRAECDTYNKAVREYNTDVRKVHIELQAAIEALYGKDSAVAKYMHRQHSPHMTEITFASISDRINRLQRDSKVKQAEKDKLDKLVRAVKFCVANGKDPDAYDAISLASDVRHEQLVAEKLKSGEIFTTSGGCDECDTWDGVSHRCSCGNRRMYWGFSGDFEDMYIFPEAY